MTPNDAPLSRRQILAGLGAVGLSAAGAGFGSVSYLTDREQFAGTIAAGSLDLAVGYRSTYNGDLLASAPGGDDPRADCDTPGLVDGAGVPAVTLDDMKPGDCGTITAALHVCANPSRLWVAASLVESVENVLRPEETLAGDSTPDTGEIHELVEVTCWVDDDADGVLNEDERVVFEGTFTDFVAEAETGVLLTEDGDGPTCADGDSVVTVSIAWCLPLDGDDHNRAVTDSMVFDIAFGAVQCRHDPTGRNPFANATTPIENATQTGDSAE